VAIDPTPLVLVRRDRLRIQLKATPIYAIIIVFEMGVKSLIYSVVGGFRRRSERSLLTAQRCQQSGQPASSQKPAGLVFCRARGRLDGLIGCGGSAGLMA
jgi:hypothetical protein